MKDILLITSEEIKDNAPISQSIDPQLLEPFIPLAQTFHLKPILGDPLFNELITSVSGDTLSGDNYTLIYTYIEPVVSWFALYEAYPFIWSKINAKGATKSFSDNSESLSKKEFELIKQEIYDKAVTFKNLLIDYLNDNDDKFPSYRTEGSSTKSNSSGIYLGKNYYRNYNDYCW